VVLNLISAYSAPNSLPVMETGLKPNFLTKLQKYDSFTCTITSGFAFGGHWSVIPAIASDLFGLNSFAAL